MPTVKVVPRAGWENSEKVAREGCQIPARNNRQRAEAIARETMRTAQVIATEKDIAPVSLIGRRVYYLKRVNLGTKKYTCMQDVIEWGHIKSVTADNIVIEGSLIPVTNTSNYVVIEG